MIWVYMLTFTRGVPQKFLFFVYCIKFDVKKGWFKLTHHLSERERERDGYEYILLFKVKTQYTCILNKEDDDISNICMLLLKTIPTVLNVDYSKIYQGRNSVYFNVKVFLGWVYVQR